MTETLDYSRYFWQGENVRLRPLRIEDAEQSFIMSLDSPARQVLQLGIELPTSVELQKEALEKFVGCKKHNGIIVFGIETLAGEHVGGISLHSVNDKNGTFSSGLIIARPRRRQGYGEDALRILLKYGFWERRFQKFNSACMHTNTASVRFHRKFGFVEEGRRRRHIFFNGQYHDEILFGMTREEFDERENKKEL